MTSQIESTVFGKLQRSRARQEYSTTMLNRGASIAVRFTWKSDDAMVRLLPFAERIWKGRSRIFKVFREYAVAELLTQLNEFLDCGEEVPPHVTANQLRKILASPFSMAFFESGNETLVCEICGGDDDSLHEHCLSVYLDEMGQISTGEVVSLV